MKRNRKLAMLLEPYKLRRTLGAGFAALALAAHPAAAQRLTIDSARYAVRPIPSGAALAAAAVVFGIPELFASSLPHGTCNPLPCDPARLNALDRSTPGPINNTADLASTGTMALTGLGSVALLVTQPESWQRREEDAVVWFQAMGTTSALLAWSKVLFHRPRPVMYTTAAVDNIDNGLSFPSGHTTAAFAAIAAYASIAHRHGGDSGSRKLATWALVGTAAGTALLRVVARRHFPTDVMAGAVLGGASGWLVPAIYPMH